MVAAFFITYYLCLQQAKRQGVSVEPIANLIFYVFIFGLLGARLLYILLNLGSYLKNPWEIIMLQRGGMAWFGGLFFGSGTAIWYIKRHKLDLFATLDLFVPFAALGQAIGRIGCLLNGCCYGRESQYGLYFWVHGKTLIPTQIYSTLLLLAIFVILRFKQDAQHSPGQVLRGYLLLDSCQRFFIEYLRNDSARNIFGLTIFQVLCLVVFSVALILTPGVIAALRKPR